MANFARQYLIDKAKGVATDIFTGVSERIISNLAQLNPLLNKAVNGGVAGKQKGKLGGEWDKLLQGQFQEYIGSYFPEYLDSVWFEAEVSANGTPQSDGINLRNVSLDLKSKDGKNHPNPDFIIKPDGGPESTDFAAGKGDKSYLIGDFKYSWDRVKGDSDKPQFKAIMNYANFTNRHQVVPIALYITMIGGKSKLELHRVTKKAIQNHGVVPQFLTLFPGIRS